MDLSTQTKLSSLMEITEGDSNIIIGLIDGPVNLTHPAFHGSKIKAVRESQPIVCKNANSISCRHGTFIAGILCAKREVAAPAICPGCTLLIRPIFVEQIKNDTTSKIKGYDDSFTYLPNSNPEELSDAIIEIVNKGTKIINLSLGLSSSSLVTYSKLQEAYDYARKQGVIIVAATGNQGSIGRRSLLENEWIIPVVACDERGQFNPISNIGLSIGKRGLMAPGIDISSTSASGGYIRLSGTSFAAPFVTGALSLLWSIFPQASAGQLIYSIRMNNSNHGNRSIIPPLLNVEVAYQILERMLRK